MPPFHLDTKRGPCDGPLSAELVFEQLEKAEELENNNNDDDRADDVEDRVHDHSLLVISLKAGGVPARRSTRILPDIGR